MPKIDPLPFIPGHIYHRRSEIHHRYGGNWQGGICPSASFPYIFIFTGRTGHQHGYLDRWDNSNVFTYTGEGQTGDMKFTKGNLALRDHLQTGRRVFLFESVKKGFVKFVSEVEIFDWDYFETHDTVRTERIGIKFFFKRRGATIGFQAQLFDAPVLVGESGFRTSNIYPNVTEREGLVTSRVGQGAYRKRIIHRWEYKCAVTGFNDQKILIASHILPWSESDHNQRLDVDNGILLSPTFDALFDQHLVSFEDSGKIILSNSIEIEAFKKIGVIGKEQIKNFSNYNAFYLEKHRSKFEILNRAE